MSTLLPSILRDFRNEYPDIELDLEELPNHHQVSALLEERVDIAFLVFPFQLPEGVSSEILFRDEFVVAIPAEHPLAGLDLISLSMLASERWIIFPRHVIPALYDAFTEACATAGFVPDITVEVHGAQAQVGLVSAGLGVAIVPQGMYQSDRPDVVFRRLNGGGPPLSYQLAMAYSSETQLRHAFKTVARANRARAEQV